MGRRAGRRHRGTRRRAREMAIQMLYQQELGDSPLDQIFASFDSGGYAEETDGGDGAEAREPDPANRPPGPPGGAAGESEAEESFAHARRLVEGTLTHRQAIDQRIRAHAENWRLERMPAIDRNILRLAVFEMLHQQGVPKLVVVDEAIELAKRFGSEDSGRFVNGLLDGILHAPPESAAAADG